MLGSPVEKLTAKEQKRFEICTEQILKGLQTVWDTGLALLEIRDSKLYRQEFDTFEEFCQQTFHIEKSHAYRLIECAEVKESLEGTKAEALLLNENQARALAVVPENKRAQVLSNIARTGDPITAPSISQYVEAKGLNVSPIGDVSQSCEKKNEVVELDKTGYPIPNKLLELWHDPIPQEILTHLSHARAALDRVMHDKGVNWAEVNVSGTLSDLNKVWVSLECAKPFAVCPFCAGHVSTSCTCCKGRGLLSEFKWKSVVPTEMKELRARANQRRSK